MCSSDLEAPFGHAGTRLHEWFFPTRTFRAMQGQPGGSTGVDDAFASAWGPGIGAEIMGRGKFGPHHGPWPDQEWTGWWGDTPPFRTPVFVLTHHLRPEREGCEGYIRRTIKPALGNMQVRKVRDRYSTCSMPG